MHELPPVAAGAARRGAAPPVARRVAPPAAAPVAAKPAAVPAAAAAAVPAAAAAVALAAASDVAGAQLAIMDTTLPALKTGGGATWSTMVYDHVVSALQIGK